MNDFAIADILRDFSGPIVTTLAFGVSFDLLGFTKDTVRAIALGWLSFLSTWCICLGDSWTINEIPIKYLGYIISLFAVLGLFGMNIWAGGPLDLEKEDSETDNSATP